MNEDPFDRELQTRLRAYESRIPAADAPVDGTAPVRSARWPLIGLAAASVAVVVAVAVLLAQPRGNVGNASPSPTPSTSPSKSALPIPSASPTPIDSTSAPPASGLPATAPAMPEPTPASADLTWSRTGSFPNSGGLSMVTAVARIGEGYVAVGVEFAQPLPVFGWTPVHEGRAWTSADGRSWEALDLGPDFENVRFGPLIQTGDGSLISLGERGVAGEFGIEESESAAWTTTDGRTWKEVDAPLEGYVADVEQGPRGVLAVVHSGDVRQLWLSEDAITWELVHSLDALYVDVGAGNDGFAAVGWVGDEDGSPFSIASADGRVWIDGPVPPFGRFLEVASHGGDWVVVDDPGGTAPTWFSVNGLDWSAYGKVPLQTIEVSGVECREYRSQVASATPWLVITSELTYPCSESGFVVHGTQYLSIDGAAWRPIPLAAGTPDENRSGSSVSDALATDGGLILVGEENGGAAFWFGEAP